MQTGTTTGAARMLHTTQPSVSRLISQMQAASGLRLFDMQNGRLRPTAEALELFDTIQRHFRGLESIEARIESMRHSGSGMLRLGCTPSLGLGLVPAALSLFLEHYPEANINVQTLGSHYLRDGLLHGLFDLVLSTGTFCSQAAQVQEERMHCSAAVCVMRIGHSLAQRREVCASDLKDILLLSLNADDELSMALCDLLAAHDVVPANRIETTYASTVCSMAMCTDGVGIVNEHVARVFAAGLAIRPFRPRIPVEVYLAYAPQRAPSLLAARFADMVRAAIG